MTRFNDSDAAYIRRRQEQQDQTTWEGRRAIAARRKAEKQKEERAKAREAAAQGRRLQGTYEAAHAAINNITINEVRKRGYVAVPCTCTEPRCYGWRMAMKDGKPMEPRSHGPMTEPRLSGPPAKSTNGDAEEVVTVDVPECARYSHAWENHGTPDQAIQQCTKCGRQTVQPCCVCGLSMDPKTVCSRCRSMGR